MNKAARQKSRAVLVTRPASQAEALCTLLEDAGFQAKSLPALTITRLEPDPTSKNRIENLDHYDTIIVVSPNAARIGMESIEDYWPQMPDKLAWFAIGNKTAEELKRFNIIASQPQEGFTSEDLLALPALADVAGQKILLLKGKAGRDKLETELSARGATVESLEVYKRELPAYDATTIKNAFSNPEPWVIQASSAETIENLLSLCSRASVDVLDYPVLVGSERVANIAREKHFKDVIIARDATNESIVEKLVELDSREPDRTEALVKPEAEPEDKKMPNSSPEQVETKSPEQAKKSSSPLHLFLILVLLCSTAYLYYLHFEPLIAGAADKDQQEKDSAKTAQELKKLDSRLLEQKTQIEHLTQSNNHLITRLNSLSDSQRSQWLATEAQSLVQLAHQRLVLVQDSKTAYSLLLSADKVLSQVNTADVSELRRILARDILRLKRANEIDIESIYMKIDAVRSEIAESSPASKKLDIEKPEENAGEQQSESWTDKFWRKLDQYFVVTEHEGSSPPVLTEQQQFLSRQQAIVLLEQSQLALLQGKSEIFHRSLDQSVKWIDKHLAYDTALRDTLSKELTELQKIDVSPAMPDIQQSLKAAQDFLDMTRERNFHPAPAKETETG